MKSGSIKFIKLCFVTLFCLFSITFCFESSYGASHSKPNTLVKKAPALDVITAPVRFQFTFGGHIYQWGGPMTFTPAGSDQVRSVSGVGDFVQVDVPITISWCSMSPAAVIGGASTKMTIALNRNAGSDVSVVLTSGNIDAVTVPPSVTVPAGMSTVSVNVQTRAVGNTTTLLVPITATLNGVTKSATITLQPPPPPLPVGKVFAADGVTLLTHALPGTKAVIIGSNFGATPGHVFFDPLGTTPTPVWTDTRIETTVPGVGTMSNTNITIRVARSEPRSTYVAVATNFTIDKPAPPGTITSVTTTRGEPIPPEGLVVGNTIVVNGSGFGQEVVGTNISHLFWGAFEFPKQSWTDTQIVASITVPGTAVWPGPQSLTVKRADGQSIPGPSVTVIPIPSTTRTLIKNIRTTSDSPLIWPLALGQKAKVVGQGFGSSGGRFWVNGSPTLVDTWTDTAIIFTLTQMYPDWVTVENANGNIYSSRFLKDGSGPVPEASTFNTFYDAAGNKVTQATQGDVLTLKGTQFATQGMVIYSNWAVCDIVSWTDTQIQFKVPFTWWDNRVSSVEVYPGMDPTFPGGVSTIDAARAEAKARARARGRGSLLDAVAEAQTVPDIRRGLGVRGSLSRGVRSNVPPLLPPVRGTPLWQSHVSPLASPPSRSQLPRKHPQKPYPY